MKETIEMYKDICAEIDDLEELSATVISDTVSGSEEEYPYTQHAITVRGIADQPKYIVKINSLKQKKEEAERYVESISSPRKRRLIRCVMKYGCRWNVVRRVMRENKSSDALRMEFERIFK